MVNVDDPIARKGLIKYDLQTSLEQFLFTGGILAAVAVVILLQIGVLGGRRSAPDHRALPYVPLAVVASVVFFVLRHFTDNHYLVDPHQHRVFYHSQFLWFRSVRLVLRREDILAVATRGQKHSSKRGTWWEYQVVLIGANGHIVPFSDSKREALDECDAQAETVGGMLDCDVYKSPACCDLVVEANGGKVSLNYQPLRWGLTRRDRTCLVLVVGAFVVFVYLAIAWVRSAKV